MFEHLRSALGDAGIMEPERSADQAPEGLIEAIGTTRRLESVLMARRLAAVAVLLKHRSAAEQADPERQFNVVDGYEQTCAEVSAVLNISATSAGFVVHYAEVLAERLPHIGALLASGQTDWRTTQLIISRTDLVDDELIARLDETLAARLAAWQSWSRQRIINAIDTEVLAVDADAAKQRRQAAEDERFISIDGAPNGMAQLYGQMSAADGTTLDGMGGLRPRSHVNVGCRQGGPGR